MWHGPHRRRGYRRGPYPPGPRQGPRQAPRQGAAHALGPLGPLGPLLLLVLTVALLASMATLVMGQQSDSQVPDPASPGRVPAPQSLQASPSSKGSQISQGHVRNPKRHHRRRVHGPQLEAPVRTSRNNNNNQWLEDEGEYFAG